MMRAVHLALDGQPKIHIDEYAWSFLDDDQRARIAAHDAIYRAPHVVASRSHILARSAFTEARLLDAIAGGCRQYVLLGAGYDSSPLRLANSLADCVTFEVDHPATQASKRAALDGLEWPANVRFVAVDFEIDQLLDCLAAAGWRADQPSFWSWLGVTMYLTDDAVMHTLRDVARSAAGTTIVFNFNVDDDGVEPEHLRWRQTGAGGVARQGEPWINTYDPAVLATRVAGLGFGSVENVGRDYFQQRYFDGRTDGLFFSTLTGTIVATV